MKYTFILIVSAILIAGCGKKSGGLANKAGEAVGEKLTDFGKGVGQGIDKEMMVKVALSPEVQALGLTSTVAKKSVGIEFDKKSIAVYMIASQKVSKTLVARAFNADGLEVGRSKKEVIFEKDDAAYVTFVFDPEMDTAMVQKYSIGL